MLTRTEKPMNAIIVDSGIGQQLCDELLAINHINKIKDQVIQAFYEIPGNYSSYKFIYFICVKTEYATYDKLVSIMKPYGLKVIDSNKVKKVLELQSYDTFTEEVYNSLYDEGDSASDYIVTPPSDLYLHYKNVIKGLPYLYCYNIHNLALYYLTNDFSIKDQIKLHKLRHKALLNRVNDKLVEMKDKYINI
jgi:hypothetical protein